MLFGTDMLNKFIHSRSSLENHTRFQTKIAKVYLYTLVFRPRRHKNRTFLGGIYIYGLYKGVPQGIIY